jgi:hypothetical protein
MGARGPLAQDRLSERDDGKLEYRLSMPLPGGATTLVVTPVQLLKRLVAVMAKPRIHLTRFFGLCGAQHRPNYAERSIMRSLVAHAAGRHGADSA